MYSKVTADDVDRALTESGVVLPATIEEIKAHVEPDEPAMMEFFEAIDPNTLIESKEELVNMAEQASEDDVTTGDTGMGGADLAAADDTLATDGTGDEVY
jgi:hypothetical protein